MAKRKRVFRKKPQKAGRKKRAGSVKAKQHKHARKIIRRIVKVRHLSVPSVRSVVSRLKNVRKAHQKVLKKMAAHKGEKFSGRSRSRALVRKRVSRKTEAANKALNTFFYNLGATLGSSKTIFAPEKK